MLQDLIANLTRYQEFFKLTLMLKVTLPSSVQRLILIGQLFKKKRKFMRLLPIIMLFLIAGCGDIPAPSGGHNGLNFDMNRRDIEKLGFVCKESSAEEWFSFKCGHMDMVGQVFGHSTSSYDVLINRTDGKVAQISANFTDVKKFSDFMEVSSRAEDFYPTKLLSSLSGSSSMLLLSNGRNEKLDLFYFQGVPPFFPASTRVSFWSSSRPWSDQKK